MGILSEISIDPKDFDGFLEKTKGRKVVVLLSSGGLRIVCHLPLLKVLEELDLQVDELWGVSAGSIAGGLWASGRSASEIEDEILTVRKSQIYEFFLITGLRAVFPSKNAEKAGLIVGKKLEKYIGKLIGSYNNPLMDIHDLFVLAYNRSFNCKAVIRIGYKPGTIVISMDRDNIVKVEKGTLADIIHASFATPVMFRPKRLNGQYYIDGGLAENYPVLTAFNHYRVDVEAGTEKRGLLMVGVNIGYSGEFGKRPSSLINSIAESYDIVGCELGRLQMALLDETIKSSGLDCEVITIDPGIHDMPLADFKRVPAALETALATTLEELTKIKI